MCGMMVYLVDCCLDMFLSLLSENLVLLLERRDRFAVSCVWMFDRNFDVVDVWFGCMVIYLRY